MTPCSVRPSVAPEDPEPVAGNYFVSAYPPFSTWTRDDLPSFRAALDEPAPAGAANAAGSPAETSELGFYVHVPFCVKRCPYCYYLAYAETPGDRIAAYVDALLAESAIYANTDALRRRPPGFVYFGGGTPSLLPTAKIRTLLAGLGALLDFSAVREMTFECAPQSVTGEKLSALKHGGVTRLSMGVQQLDDAVLEQSGRVHKVVDIMRAYEKIRRTGFEVVNLDLMVGMVGETEESFFASLAGVIEMRPDSITLYQMEVPLNTPLYRDIADKDPAESLATWDTKHRRLEDAFAHLESAGYSVRSAYAAVRDPERHTFVYQDAQYGGADLIGLGVASFSYLSGVHQQNVADLDGYLGALQEGRLPLGRACALSADERLVRELVLQLKLGTVDLATLGRKHAVDVRERFVEQWESLEQAGLLEFDDGSVSLTRRGLVRADRLLPRFYDPRHRDVRYS
jgi:oxygen-independent coproporphyrinogen-3 oxidase